MTDPDLLTRGNLLHVIQNALHAPCIERWELLRQLGKNNEDLTKHGPDMHKQQATAVLDAIWPFIPSDFVEARDKFIKHLENCPELENYV